MGDVSAEEGLNRECVGKTYEADARRIEEDEIRAYAEATNNDNPLHVDVEHPRTREAGGLVAPPLFAVRPLHDILGAAMLDPDLGADLMRLVHGEQAMRFHAPIRPGDELVPRGEIAAIEAKSSGELLDLRLWLVRDGERIVEAKSVMFIRASDSAGGDEDDEENSATEGDEASRPARDVIYEETEAVAADQSVRYAEASGDRNPIHTNREVAQAAGFPDVILHGLCTMAFAANAIVDGVADGRPRALKRMSVRFSKPVLPEQSVTTRIWGEEESEDGRAVRFDAVDDAGQPVLTRGRAKIDPSSLADE